MNQFYLKELTDHDAFDPSSMVQGVPFTQAHFYGDWQKSLGRTVRRFVVTKGGASVAYFQMIQYPLIRGKSYIYMPYGPVTTDFSEDFFIFLKKELTRIAEEIHTVFVRLDYTPSLSSPIVSDENRQKITALFTKAPSYTYHSAYFQPRYEWFLDVRPTEEDILKAMHEKTRYSVRLAERKGIVVEIVTEAFEKYFESFYALMAGTATRNGFSLHDKKYYELIFKSLHTIPGSYLSVAQYEGKVLAIDLVIVYGGVATYVFGGSSNEERNRMPTYLAQWRAICQAKKLGCHAYNFGGITSDTGALDGKAGNLYKGWEGLTSFKKKFGGYEVRHSDFFDIVVQPFWYRIYNLRKRLKKL